jgi:glutamate-5-semialdehyde dehydrogenase
MSIIEQAREAKEAAVRLAAIQAEIKNKALNAIADAIEKNKGRILAANKKDVEEAEKANLSVPLVKRLRLDETKIREIIDSVKSVAKLEDPVGKTLSATELDTGLEACQVTCPIGVIGAIFESRPDALVQISTLCLKSGNAVILKGGSEAKNTNKVLAELIRKAAEQNGIPKGAIQLIETREDVKEMLKLDSYIDLLVPRGSNEFVKYIQDNTKIPVLGHSSGICHIYVDKDADIDKAIKICLDAKCQYPAVCNAMETLLVHKDIADRFLKKLHQEYKKTDVELRGCEKTVKILGGIKKADEKDWSTEYNDLILSIKVVDNVEDAIEHINKYSSKHTDAIVTENQETARKFMSFVDSSSVMCNCSTRFSDGFRYGKGAEIGISTSKIHARGPVGLEGLVIYKYVVVGKGHIVGDYAGKNAKKFTHKKLSKKLAI